MLSGPIFLALTFIRLRSGKDSAVLPLNLLHIVLDLVDVFPDLFHLESQTSLNYLGRGKKLCFLSTDLLEECVHLLIPHVDPRVISTQVIISALCLEKWNEGFGLGRAPKSKKCIFSYGFQRRESVPRHLDDLVWLFSRYQGLRRGK